MFSKNIKILINNKLLHYIILTHTHTLSVYILREVKNEKGKFFPLLCIS